MGRDDGDEFWKILHKIQRKSRSKSKRDVLEKLKRFYSHSKKSGCGRKILKGIKQAVKALRSRCESESVDSSDDSFYRSIRQKEMPQHSSVPVKNSKKGESVNRLIALTKQARVWKQYDLKYDSDDTDDESTYRPSRKESRGRHRHNDHHSTRFKRRRSRTNQSPDNRKSKRYRHRSGGEGSVERHQRSSKREVKTEKLDLEARNKPSKPTQDDMKVNVGNSSRLHQLYNLYGWPSEETNVDAPPQPTSCLPGKQQVMKQTVPNKQTTSNLQAELSVLLRTALNNIVDDHDPLTSNELNKERSTEFKKETVRPPVELKKMQNFPLSPFESSTTQRNVQQSEIPISNHQSTVSINRSHHLPPPTTQRNVQQSEIPISNHQSTVSINHHLPPSMHATAKTPPTAGLLDWTFKIPKMNKSNAEATTTKPLNKCGTSDDTFTNDNSGNDEYDKVGSGFDDRSESTGNEIVPTTAVQTSPDEQNIAANLMQLINSDQFTTFVEFVNLSIQAMNDSANQEPAIILPKCTEIATHSSARNGQMVLSYRQRLRERKVLQQHLRMEKVRPVFKNTDPDLHSMTDNLAIFCRICPEPVLGRMTSLVTHYVNEHPNSEIFVSRIPPAVAERLRSRKGGNKCKIIRNKFNQNAYQQLCFFCNEKREYTKTEWILHMSRHTGYYRHRCNHCSKLYLLKQQSGQCFFNNDFDTVDQTQYNGNKLDAYVCNLCNFVRFHKREIKNHLTNEHADEATKFKKVNFLSFASP